MSDLIALGSWRILAACWLVVLLSGFLRGFSGFGFALAASPLLASLMPPREAVPVVLILQLGSSLLGARRSITTWDARPSVLIAAAAITTTPLGVLLLGWVGADTARIGMATVTLAAALVLGGLRLELDLAAWWKPVPFGLAAGLLGGASAMPGPPVIAYFMARRTAPATARASMNLIFMSTSMVALVADAVREMLSQAALYLVLLCLPAMILGTMFGSAAFERASSATYRRVGVGSLVVVALATLARTAAGCL